MRVIVTGSSGTIGTRLCETLLQQGHTVIGIDIVPNKWNPEINAITTLIDLRDDKLLDEKGASIEGDAIIHLAANARVHDLVIEPRRALDNMTMLFNTLEWARQKGINKFMFASSRETYGNIPVEICTEDLVRVENCESPYTASKTGGEALVHSYRRCYKMSCVIVRFSNVYGAYDESDRVVPLFIRRCKANEPLKVFGKQKCLDFTYIDDTVGGIIQALEKIDEVNGETFNLAFGEGTTLVSLADTVKELLGSNVPVEIGEPRVGEIFHYVADISKAKRLLGYNPQTPFSEGIRKAVEWYNAH